MICTVFYSWQSDLPNAVNRGFIGQALESAAKRISSDQSVIVSPVVDRDTVDVPGAPDIATAIFEKIRSATVFVADVSLINSEAADQRRTPNPNVLIELGYALRHLGPERVLLVFNSCFGRVEELPFDLRLKRVTQYHARKDDEGKSAERQKLSKALEQGLRTILLSTPNPVVVQLVSDEGMTEVVVPRTDVAPARSRDEKAGLAARLICINLQIHNLGTSLISDLRCVIDFSGNFTVMNERSLEARWRVYPDQSLTALTASRAEVNLGEIFGFSAFTHSVGRRSGRPRFAPNTDVPAQIQGGQVSFHIRKLPQRAVRPLEPLYILFPSADAVESFMAGYLIESDEIVRSGTLPIKVTDIVWTA